MAQNLANHSQFIRRKWNFFINDRLDGLTDVIRLLGGLGDWIYRPSFKVILFTFDTMGLNGFYYSISNSI